MMQILPPKEFLRELRTLAQYIPGSSPESALAQVIPSFAALIFLRWVDFQDREQAAVAEFDGVQYQPILPAYLSWERLVGELQKTRHTYFDDAVSSLELQFNSNLVAQQLHRIAPLLRQTGALDHDLLRALMGLVGTLGVESPEERELSGLVLETALHEFAEKSKSAENFTPRPVVELMVDIANPHLGERIYDPCFGMGGLLAACAKRLNTETAQVSVEKWRELQDSSLFGTELNPSAYAVGLARIALAGFSHAGLEIGNSLERPVGEGSAQGKYDCILAVPPWGGKVRHSTASHYPIMTQNTESLFVQHVMAALKPGGRAVLAVPEGFLFRAGADEAIRRSLLENFKVESVMSLPAGSFRPYTMIKTNLLVFSRESPQEDVTFYAIDTEKLRSVRKRVFASSGSRELPTWDTLVDDMPAKAWSSYIESIFDNLLLGPARGVNDIFGVGLNLYPGYPLRSRKQRRQWGISSVLNTVLPQFWDSDIESPISVVGVVPIREIAERNWELTVKASHERLDLLLSSLKQTDEAMPQVPLSKVANIAAGRSYRTGDLITADPLAEVVGFVRVSDISNGRVIAPDKYVYNDPSIRDSQRLKRGDLALGITGSVGKVGIVQEDVPLVASSGVAVIKPHREIRAEYLLAILNSESYREWMVAYSRGTAAQHLQVKRLLEMPIPVPPVQIQVRLAERVAGTQLDALEELLDLLHEEVDAPHSAWLKSSVAVDTLFKLDANSARAEALRAVEKFLSELRTSRNQIVHVSNSRISCALHDWMKRLLTATENLTNIAAIPPGASRYAIIESTLPAIEKSVEQLPATSDFAVVRARKVTERLRDLLRSEVRELLSDVQVEATINYFAEGQYRRKDVVLQLRNRSSLPLRQVHIETLPDCGQGESSYWSEGQDLRVDLKPPTGLQERSITITVNWIGTRLDGSSATGALRLDVPFGMDSDIPITIDLGENPYIYGNPIPPGRADVFFGRQHVVDQIRRQLDARTANVVLLEGNRRTGKSSVLYRLTAPGVLGNWVVVNCSMQGARGVVGAGGVPSHEVFRLLAQRIAETLLDQGLYVPIGADDVGRTHLPTRFEVTRKCLSHFSVNDSFALFDTYVADVLTAIAPRHLLLMLDEFDKIQEGIASGVTSPAVPENLRYLIHRHENLSAILSGSPRLKHLRETYWSALFGLGFRIGVSRLAEDDARQLVTYPVAGRLDFTKEACDFIVNMTDCHPFLVQSLCSHIFDLAASQHLRTISRQEVATAIDVMVTNNEHFATIWGEYIRTARQRLIVALCGRFANGPDPITIGFIGSMLESYRVPVPRESQLQDDIKELKELEVLEYSIDGHSPQYRITIPLLIQWLEQHIPFDEIVRAAIAEI